MKNLSVPSAVVLSLALSAGSLHAAQGAPQGDKPAQPASPPSPEPKPEAKPDAKAAPKAEPKAEPKPEAEAPAAAVDAKVLGFTVQDIDGKAVDLAQYRGKVVVIVNTASRCGYTPQYKSLEKLYREHKDAGLVVLAFPANDFGGQEPLKEAEIKSFCSTKYDVTFPLFSKISVKGADQHPLFKKLAAQPKPIGGDPQWNFTKFIVDRQGNVVARFEPGVKPDDAKLKDKVKELLDQKG